MEQRLQSLLEKLQTGQYYGDISQPDSEIKSYDVSFDGTATSLSDGSAQNVKAKFVIENLSTKDYIATFKVTGGQVQIGQTTYDLAFGKIRIMSDHTAKDSILLIGNLIDEQGNSNGIRLSISSAQSLDGDFGQQPIDLTVVQPSKIAGQWLLEGNGKLSLS
ncbi:MAG: hypothetical protein EPO63_07430 [Candidatus Nitrosotenuis sp.]|nr:MAG: hypothetical protein EPO63_07430 [Candidatus Nitrosotenuis sp.]